MVNPNVKLTYRDYLNLPESEDKRYEVIAGDLHMVPSPSSIHQTIVFKLAKILDAFVEANELGRVFIAPLDVVLSDIDVLQPDIFFISKNREGIITEHSIQGAPDLVVEVLSPATAERDRTLKKVRYLRFGVREYWLVDPVSRTIEVMKTGQTDFETVRVYPEGTNATSLALPGLQVDVGGVFA